MNQYKDPNYLWDEWFGHETFELYYGRDYDCSQSSMYQQIRNAASTRGLKVIVVDQNTHFVIVVKQRAPIEDGA